MRHAASLTQNETPCAELSKVRALMPRYSMTAVLPPKCHLSPVHLPVSPCDSVRALRSKPSAACGTTTDRRSAVLRVGDSNCAACRAGIRFTTLRWFRAASCTHTSRCSNLHRRPLIPSTATGRAGRDEISNSLEKLHITKFLFSCFLFLNKFVIFIPTSPTCLYESQQGQQDRLGGTRCGGSGDGSGIGN